MEETGVPGENHRPAASHWQTLSHNIVSSATGYLEKTLGMERHGECVKMTWSKERNEIWKEAWVVDKSIIYMGKRHMWWRGTSVIERYQNYGKRPEFYKEGWLMETMVMYGQNPQFNIVIIACS